MKKIILLLCVILFTGYSLADGAFGTYKGMTIQELEKEGVELTKVDNNVYVSITAPKSNRNFRMYRYSFKDKTNGLCNVHAFGKSVETDKKGTELFRQFLEIKNVLDKKYGNFRAIKSAKPKDNLMETALNNKTVSVYMAIPDDDNNSLIAINAYAETISTGRVDVQYMLDYCGDDIDDTGL